MGMFFLPSVGVNPQPKLLHVLISSPICDSRINEYDFREKKNLYWLDEIHVDLILFLKVSKSPAESFCINSGLLYNLSGYLNIPISVVATFCFKLQ